MGQNFGFVKVAAAIPRVEIADCIYNEREIYNQIIEAVHRNVQIIVFPELSITAYTCGDLFGHTLLLEQARKALSLLVEETSDYPILCIVGMPVAAGNCLYNCAVVFQRVKYWESFPKVICPIIRNFMRNVGLLLVFRQRSILLNYVVIEFRSVQIYYLRVQVLSWE